MFYQVNGEKLMWVKEQQYVKISLFSFIDIDIEKQQLFTIEYF